MKQINTEVAIIGGGMGGVAAALMLQDLGVDFVLTEETAWIGGQMTAQGVSAFDEHAHIEQFGGTASYNRLRARIRQHYVDHFQAPPIMAESVLGPDMPLNPGNGWVSRLCFATRFAWYILSTDLKNAQILLHHRPIRALMDDDTIKAVICADENGDAVQINAKYFIDATELGDLLPLTYTAYVTGAEAHSQTGEPNAPKDARPNEVQGFTYCFFVEFCPGEDHTIPQPADYAYNRDHQPYTLRPIGRDGNPVIYDFFRTSEQGNPPFWTYRRVHDGKLLLGGNDVALINWGSNDYHGGNIIDADPADRERYLLAAKNLSLGFLYWLQTECPRDDGGVGYPELRLRTELTNTPDGLCQYPYIRESRRIVPLQHIIETDISADHQPGARARHVADSVGIGWYPMDLHSCVGNPDVSMYAPTRPFQIPLGALIPQTTRNLIAGCKNIGTTHLTNGAYRLHPTEWAIGAAAGMLAAFCVEQGTAPQAVHADGGEVRALQRRLVGQGCPIFWAVDVPIEAEPFAMTQLLGAWSAIKPDSARWHRLDVQPEAPLGDDVDLDRVRAIAAWLGHARVAPIEPNMTWAALCGWLVNGITN